MTDTSQTNHETGDMPANGSAGHVTADIDLEGRQIARVYAQGLFGAAEDSDQAEAIVAEMTSLVEEVLNQHPEFESLLGSAMMSEEEKVGMLDRVFKGKMSSLLLSCLKVIAEHDRLGCLRVIAEELDALFNTSRGRVVMELTLAAETDDALVEQISSALSKSLNVTPIITKSIDPSLIAGFMVKIGDRVFDGSVKTKLANMREEMIRRSYELIQTQRDKIVEEA